MNPEKFPGWTPVQLAKHYDFPLHYTGAGQKVAIISLGGKIDRVELAADFAALRVPMPDYCEHLVEPNLITAKQDQGGNGETHLDLEVLASLCPQAHISVYRAPNAGGFAAAVQQAVSDKNSVISISWGNPESIWEEYSSMEKALTAARKAGVTVCVSSGDRGANPVAVPAATGEASGVASPQVNYPASSDQVLACGGTELVLEDGHYREVVWNNLSQGGGASGGGVSKAFTLPDWQRSAGVAIKQASTGFLGRVIPDVAGLAAGGDWKIYVEGGKTAMAGGTSAVAPLWASLITLCNQAREEKGKPPLGFINDRLYAQAARGSLFRDITAGDNRSTPHEPGYEATIGFDACTGWGSPRGSALFKALCEFP